MPLPPTAHTPEPEESLLQSGTGTPSEPHYQTRTTSSPFPAEPGAPSHLGSALRAEAADRTIHQSAQLNACRRSFGIDGKHLELLPIEITHPAGDLCR